MKDARKWNPTPGFLTPILLLVFAASLFAAVKDVPFPQDTAVKFPSAPELQGAAYRRLIVDRNNVAYVLTDRGIARLFENTLALDRSFRPLAGKPPLDIALTHGELVYLLEDSILSNGSAGKIFERLPKGVYGQIAMTDDGSALLAGDGALGLVRSGRHSPLPAPPGVRPEKIFGWQNEFFMTTGDAVYRLRKDRWEEIDRAEGITTFGFTARELFVGTHNGYHAMGLASGKITLAHQTRLPATNITRLVATASGLWAGTTRGVFHKTVERGIDYYASKRWLADDHVVDLQPDRDGTMFVLTRAGLHLIKFTPMTLFEKASYYEKKIRQRHIRYGFCAETYLRKPGDLTTTELVDSDNDGLWSAMYMAGEAFRFAVTRDPEARAHAWETFEALERLEAINPIGGFPARSFERTGFKVSDPNHWHPTPDGQWEWKGTTSSDEIVGHMFGYAVMHETVARTDAEKQRIATLTDKIMMHIVRHNWYLIDLDGKPTLWGKWNPEYVNSFPTTVGDRRLNSVELVGFLQFAWKITGRELYRQKARELMEKHGYLENITSSIRKLGFTEGHMNLADVWNHSDDELAFLSYWLLHRYAFDEALKRKFAAAIREHWELEKGERCPLWNFICAATGAKDFDAAGALWTLREFPIDLIDWRVTNSHRQDLTRLAPNFRGQQTVELLPPDERPIMRWNSNPFTLDGGTDGHSELSGSEFLLPYWMGRYLGIIH